MAPDSPRSRAIRAVFHRQARRYDSWLDSPEGRICFPAELAALRRLAPWVLRPALEVGVGTGAFAEALGIPYGIDPAPGMLRLARRRGIRVAAAVGESLPLRAACLGTVYLIFTLCFVEDPRQVLREIKRVLRPGGSLLLGIIPRESPWGRHYRALGASGHPFYRWARFLSVEETRSLIQSEGFTLAAAASTLHQQPGETRFPENVVPGWTERAGFVALAAIPRPSPPRAPA